MHRQFVRGQQGSKLGFRERSLLEIKTRNLKISAIQVDQQFFEELLIFSAPCRRFLPIYFLEIILDPGQCDHRVDFHLPLMEKIFHLQTDTAGKSASLIFQRFFDGAERVSVPYGSHEHEREN